MQRGLVGRRIALLGADGGAGAPVREALEAAGATVDALGPASGSGEHWHGGRYAALVVLGCEPPIAERAAQLIREFLVVEKPVAAHGDGIRVLRDSGALESRRVAGPSGAGEGAGLVTDENLTTATGGMSGEDFASALVRSFGQRLEEHALDEMSDQSFPASDPPSVTPSALGAVRSGEDAPRS